MAKEKVTVIGAGLMGSGIAQIAIEAGFEAVIVDTDGVKVEKGIGNIKIFLGKKVAKEKISQEQYSEMISRLSGTNSLETGIGGAVMVVEAVFENLELKKNIFKKLDSLCPKGVILASNTSTMSISEIASVTTEQERVIGTHYFSPVPLMKLVEIVKGDKTSEVTINRTLELCQQFGKVPIVV